MPESFRSLASILTRRNVGCGAADHAADATGADAPTPAPVVSADTSPADGRIVDLLDGFVAELARLRARAAERLEEQAEAVLADIARRVLARELTAAPAEIEALLAAALREFDAGTGIVVRVSAADAQRLAGRWPVETDARLDPGDFCIEIDDGRYDATLQTRLDAMLALHRVAL